MASAKVPTKYCFDTSSLIHAWVRAYPIDSFPSFWNELDRLIAEKRIIATQEVFEELLRKSDDLHGWCAQRRSMFIEHTERVMRETTKILDDFPRLMDTVKGRSGGDPFVIALAKVTGSAVVTEENGGDKNKKIPEVCGALGMPCFKLLDVIKREKWRF
ncbi:DUF4411 family protein [Sorangium sp. So ce1182]|uniref:DUF4411 family protein n=1 Tax=Sorangium sp. So ce1182 TaxID=3133334 RepID=UPI003F5E6971